MTWKEFKDMVDFLLEEQGTDDSIEIHYIEINCRDTPNNLRVETLHEELVVV